MSRIVGEEWEIVESEEGHDLYVVGDKQPSGAIYNPQRARLAAAAPAMARMLLRQFWCPLAVCPECHQGTPEINVMNTSEGWPPIRDEHPESYALWLRRFLEAHAKDCPLVEILQRAGVP